MLDSKVWTGVLRKTEISTINTIKSTIKVTIQVGYFSQEKPKSFACRALCSTIRL